MIVTRRATLVAGASLLAAPDMVDFFGSRGFTLGGSSPAEFRALVQSEIVKWAAIVKASGAKPD